MCVTALLMLKVIVRTEYILQSDKVWKKITKKSNFKYDFLLNCDKIYSGML